VGDVTSAHVFATQVPVVPESYLQDVTTPPLSAFNAEQYVVYPVVIPVSE
jgi:hypothetical protein